MGLYAVGQGQQNCCTCRTGLRITVNAENVEHQPAGADLGSFQHGSSYTRLQPLGKGAQRDLGLAIVINLAEFSIIYPT